MQHLAQPFDVFSPAFDADPYPAYRRLREDHPLLWHEPTASYVISRYEDVRTAFTDPRFTSDNYRWQLEPVHGRTILQMDGREHAVTRALVAPAFRGTALKEHVIPLIEKNAVALIDGFRGTGHADLVAQFAVHFPLNVIADLLGLAPADRPALHRWYTSIVAFLGNFAQDPQVAADGLRTRAEFSAYLLPLISQRRQNPCSDLISALCKAEVDGTHLTDDDIRAFCSLLVTGGGEPPQKALSQLLLNLLTHPDQLAAVREDRSLIGHAIAETLRFGSPVQMITRQTSDEVKLSGGTVPQGATVTCLIGSANRDERRFSSPDRFDIFREDLSPANAFSAAAKHMSFALGRHFCVGALLAEAELSAALHHLLDSLPDMACAAGFTGVEVGVFTRGPVTLPVTFTATA
ncbi:cytochrome P450 [Streptomyces sp. NBC_01334]|uniref:cytochrome P450 n=1 Tax=Streptomyces sp. NBC_01334 TaxID=2903827 RepID=UPI002E1424D2|nr:cytochrome P450 [Streptomyces sp. NBC_01334]